MRQRIHCTAIGASSWVLVLILTPGLLAAEFRTSVRGRPLVRAANYQQSVLQNAPGSSAMEIAPLDVPGLEPLEPYGLESGAGYGVGDCCDGSHWDGACGAGCCPPGGGWCYWGSAEFLLWWRKGQKLPPLVTTSPTTTPEELAGVLGVEGTDILYATETQSGDARPGARLTAGLWFSSCHITGFGARLYMLGESTAHYNQDSDTVSVLARPFFNLDLVMEDAVQIAYPGATEGAISIRNNSRVSGGDLFFRRLFFSDSCRRVDLIGGYQFARIDTDISIASNLVVVGTGNIPLGTTLGVLDSFDTRNTYSAGVFGLWGVYDRGPVTWSLLAKVGFGNMSQRTAIRGQTTTTNVVSTVTDQGLLAVSTNSGVYKQSVFAVSPEMAFSAHII